MPLFMDLHKADDYSVKPTVEEIKRNHIADLEVQHKYGVKFLQYWINEEAGLVFCLMEAPDKESCIAVHREAHGGMPCNIIALKGGDYPAFMGKLHVNQFDIVENSDGTLDTGYRAILAIDYIPLSADTNFLTGISAIIEQTGGRLVKKPGHRDIAVFISANAAINCALEIFKNISKEVAEISIGLSVGEPVTAKDEFFGDSIQLANHLCTMAGNRQLFCGAFIKQMLTEPEHLHFNQESSVTILDKEDEKFLTRLIEAITSKLHEPSFSITALSSELGTSRSGLYRKITELTGTSANAFIRETRLKKAFQLLREKFGNVNQVAMEVGYDNPSYFTRSFQKRFGILPTQLLKPS